MPVPKPKVPLKDHCSIIYDNKLYTYQADAFQSLDLQEGGDWIQLSMGVSTTGSACVLGTFDEQPALIVIGGSSKKNDYCGLQYYSFKDSAWRSAEPADPVASNRLRHGAAFLQQSSQILTYGGSQDGMERYTSQTFLISTKKPYSVQAYNSKAQPVIDPTLLQYNTSHALVLGGSKLNDQLFLFSPDNGWTEMDQSLGGPMKDKRAMQATILNGDDGSKQLEIFDLSNTTNILSTVQLQQATKSQKRSEYVPSPHHPSKRRKRDTPLSDRPAYNASLAPQDARSGFSLASDPQGLIVMSGGNEQSPIAMFNDSKNTWVDPNVFFSGAAADSKLTPVPTPTASSTDAPTSFSPTTAPSEIAKQSNSSRDKSLTILGGTLGGVLGVAILLAIILLLLRCTKKRRETKRLQEKEYKNGSKEDMDFMDMGAEFMREAGGSAASSNHERNKSDISAHKRNHSRAESSISKRALLHAKGDSNASQKSFWSNRSTKSPVPMQAPPQISSPIQSGPSLSRGMASPGLRGENNGWSAYFMDNQMLEAMNRSNQPSSVDNRPDTYASQAHTSSSYAPSNPHTSAEVEPLSFRPSQLYPPPGLGVALSHGVSRPSPPSQRSPTPSIVSDIEEESSYHASSQGPESWSPVASSGEGERNSTLTSSDHRISSNTNSFSYAHPGERVRIPNFPMPTSGRSSMAGSPATPQGEQPPLPLRSERREQRDPSNASAESGQNQGLGLRNVVSRDLIRSNSARQRATNYVQTGTQRVNATAAEPVPRQQPLGHTPHVVEQMRMQKGQGEELGRGEAREMTTSEDMSWLNLGTSAEQRRGMPGGGAR